MRANNMRANQGNQDELGPDSAGQSGDLQGISDVADADSESVKELVEQGNAFEADAVDGVENAKDPDVAEVTTRQVPEDDVPEEYRNADYRRCLSSLPRRIPCHRALTIDSRNSTTLRPTPTTQPPSLTAEEIT